MKKEDHNIQIIKLDYEEVTLENDDYIMKELEQYSLIDAAEVHLDMAAVKYMDSSGISMLVCVTKVFKAKNKKLLLINVNDAIMNLLRMGMFENIIDIENN